jgi:MFS family permease
MFRSLSLFNYRLWFTGALVSNVGTWMQRTAQSWIVLVDLTDGDAVAVGITTALQFGPQLVLVAWTGLIADRFDRRKLLLVTQVLMGLLGIGLGALLVFGVAELWHVYLFALALGVVSAVDAPARQAFVSELVPSGYLSNAVSLNSASFNSARLVGPAAAGLLTAAIGAGWVIIINGFTFAGMIAALCLMRRDQLQPQARAPRGRGQVRAGVRYVRNRPDILIVLAVVTLISMFGMNFPIFASTMATLEFHQGAGEFGVLSSLIAIGSLTGALLAARRDRPRLRVLFGACGAFGVATILAAIMPTFWSFGAMLILVGFAAITIMTTANSTVQTTTVPLMRGRVMALYLAVMMGSTTLGAPVIGWVAAQWGPRASMLVGGASGIVAMVVGLSWMVVSHDLRLRIDHTRRMPLRLVHDRSRPAAVPRELAVDETQIAQAG